MARVLARSSNTLWMPTMCSSPTRYIMETIIFSLYLPFRFQFCSSLLVPPLLDGGCSFWFYLFRSIPLFFLSLDRWSLCSCLHNHDSFHCTFATLSQSNRWHHVLALEYNHDVECRQRACFYHFLLVMIMMRMKSPRKACGTEQKWQRLWIAGGKAAYGRLDHNFDPLLVFLSVSALDLSVFFFSSFFL